MRRLGVVLFLLLVLALCAYAAYSLFVRYQTPDETTAVLAIGLIAAVVAIWGIYGQRAITRRQVTLEHIAKLESDADQIKARLKFAELVKAGNIAQWADKRDTTDAQAVFTALNEFELIAIGIERGIIDFELYSRWYKGGAIRNWEEAHPFIIELRKIRRNPMLYHEFEEMIRWLKGSAPPRRGIFEGLWF
jgi:Domain of unknown function (DUF4760)